MKPNLLKLSALAATLVAIPGVAFSHHGTAAYDTKQTAVLKGTITNFQFQNPHVLVTFNVMGEKGNPEQWTGEVTTPSQLAREGGWTKNSLKPGDHVAVTGNPSKNGTHTMIIKDILKADGTDLRVGAARPE
jgi:Family of unknown function (DUF6152)